MRTAGARPPLADPISRTGCENDIIASRICCKRPHSLSSAGNGMARRVLRYANHREGIMRRSLIRAAAQGAILAATILGTAVAALAAGFLETVLVANKIPLTDSNGDVHKAAIPDPNLLNPWGLTASGTSPFWVSDNGAGVSTLYNTAGTPQALVVSIPAPGDPLGKK